MTDDYFVPKARARAEGCPYHPDYAIRLSQRGLFPMPVRLSRQRVGWMKSALLNYLSSHNPAA
jgi:hypothetical protein